MQKECYTIGPKDIEIDFIPVWISSESKFIRDAINEYPRTDDDVLNTLDSNIATTLARIFDAQAWVDHVESIQIEYPSHVVLKIKFRIPLAMVKSVEKEANYYPVDADGIVLPNEFFQDHQEILGKYLWIEGITSMPGSSVGDSWGDPLVSEAVLLAEHLQDDKDKFRLARIVVQRGDDKAETSNQYTLYTIDNQMIIWGTFPLPGNLGGTEDNKSRTLKAKMKKELFQKQEPKLACLRRLLKEYGDFSCVPENLKPINVSLIVNEFQQP